MAPLLPCYHVVGGREEENCQERGIHHISEHLRLHQRQKTKQALGTVILLLRC